MPVPSLRVPTVLLLGLFFFLPSFAASEAEGTRFGLKADLKTYPQASPKEALASVLEAARKGQFDYLAAHLADPSFIDDRVKRLYGGNFPEQVQDTRARLDPATLKLLGRYLKDGTWTVEKTTASVRLKEGTDRILHLKQEGRRWFLEHRWSRSSK